MWIQGSRQDEQPGKTTTGPLSKVTELMLRHPATVSPDSTIKEAVVVMAKQGVDTVPVVDGRQRLLGIVSHQSIAIRASVGDKPVEDMRVRDAMSADTTRLSVASTVSDALALMVQRRAECLPVVTRDGLVVGLLALSEIVERAASPRDTRGAWLETGYRPAVKGC